MIAFKLLRTELCFDFSFFAVLALFFFFSSDMGMSTFMSCLFHEFGHLLVMAWLDVPVERVLFYGGGICISADIRRLPLMQRIAVLLAGCAFNLMLAGVFLSLGMQSAAAINLMTAALNLLPFSQLDGSQIAESLARRYLTPITADRMLRVLRITALTAIVSLLIFIRYIPDFNIIIFLLYICILKMRYR